MKIVAVMCLLACATGSALAQEEGELTATRRIFPSIGAGLRTVRRGADGRLYILASPAPGLVVFDATGRQVLSIGELAATPSAAKGSRALITFGEDCDVDSEGRIYVADRGANAILQLAQEGFGKIRLLAHRLARRFIESKLSKCLLADGCGAASRRPGR